MADICSFLRTSLRRRPGRRSRERARARRTTSSARTNAASWKRGTPRTSCGWSFRAATTTRATRRRRGCWRRGRRRGSCVPTRATSFYVYEQQFGYAGQRYTRRGFFAAVRLEPFERRVVLPHENTLSAPKEDRRRLLRATRTQISPMFGLYRDAGGRGARRSSTRRHRRAPAVDATTTDGVRHRLWTITDRRRRSTACGCCSPTSRS